MTILELNKPIVVLLDKQKQIWYLNEVSRPSEIGIEYKENGKIHNYSDFKVWRFGKINKKPKNSTSDHGSTRVLYKKNMEVILQISHYDLEIDQLKKKNPALNNEEYWIQPVGENDKWSV